MNFVLKARSSLDGSWVVLKKEKQRFKTIKDKSWWYLIDTTVSDEGANREILVDLVNTAKRLVKCTEDTYQDVVVTKEYVGTKSNHCGQTFPYIEEAILWENGRWT